MRVKIWSSTPCRLLLLIAGLFSIATAHADPLKLIALQYPPYVYQEHGRIQGTATDLVRKVFAELQVEIEIEILPWPRALQYIQSGAADGIFTIFKTPARETFLDYSEHSLIDQTIALYAHRDRVIPYDGDLRTLEGHPIGLTRAVSYGPRFDREKTALRKQLVVVNDEIAKFQLLERGRIDLLVSNQDAANYYIQQLGLSGQVQKLSPDLEQVASFIAFSKNSPRRSIKEQFDQVLAEIRQSDKR